MGYEHKAEELGVAIIDGYPPNGWWACYDPDTHTILRHVNMGALQRHSSTWHELGHANFRHVGCDPRQEAQASLWAARHLFTPEAFVDAARIDDDLIGIAHRLFVLHRDVKILREIPELRGTARAPETYWMGNTMTDEGKAILIRHRTSRHRPAVQRRLF